MTEQITHVSKATVKPDKQVLVQQHEVVTGSPQAIIYLHADFREVVPRHGGKPQAEHIDEAYDEVTSADKTTPTDGVISALSELYEFKDDLAESFLEENPSLANLLFEAYKMIPGHFGPEVKMALEVVADPEALGDKQLFVLIRTELPRKDAREQLAELDRAWWLDALPAAEGKMEIALE